MSVTLQNLIDKVNDYTRNYTTGNVDLGNRKRAINESIASFQRAMGLPSDEVVQSFYYVTGTNYYNLNSDFNEVVDLIYHDYNFNIPGCEFEYRKYPEILRLAGLNPSKRYYSFVTYNTGAKQLLILGPNLNGGSLLESFDNAVEDGWTGTGDINTLTLDPNIKTEGSNSLKFNLTYSSGIGTLVSPALTANGDFSNWHALNAWFELDVWFASTAFSNIQFKYGTDASNYWTISSTTQSSGAALVANQWNTLAFKYQNAVVTGSPDQTNVNFFNFIFTESSSSNITGMRVDNFRVVIPDYLDLIYYTNYKGKDSNGNNLFNLNSGSDTANFGDIIPDLLDPIAKRAAVSLMPQLRQDPMLRAQYTKEVKDDILLWGKTYPRKRVVTLGKTMIRRGQNVTLKTL